MIPRPSPFPQSPLPIGLAHRGGALEEAENSPSAFQHAMDLGVTVIETDVRATRDGHAIVIHDASVDRTTDGSGAVRGLTLGDVSALRLRNGDPLMTLAGALERWPTAVLNVDVKSDDAVEPFLRAVRGAQAWDRVCAASFSSARLRRLRSLGGPMLATSLGTVEVARLRLGVPPPAADRACAVQVPRRSGPVPVVTRGFVARAHALGLAVHVWTVNEVPEMRALVRMGVDGIVTDRPSVLAAVLAERAPDGRDSDGRGASD